MHFIVRASPLASTIRERGRSHYTKKNAFCKTEMFPNILLPATFILLELNLAAGLPFLIHWRTIVVLILVVGVLAFSMKAKSREGLQEEMA